MSLPEIASDLPKGIALLAEINTIIKNVNDSLKSLKERLQSGEFNFNDGIGLLDLKNHAFLNYLANLGFVILRKLSGYPLEDDPSIERIVEARIVLERVRPLEDKFKYQIEKYLKVGKTGITSQDKSSNLKGTLDEIADSSEDEQNEDFDEDKELNDDDKLYKIPRIMPTQYPEAETKDAKAERQRKRFLQSSMISDALAEYTEDPEIIYNDSSVKNKKVIEKLKEIERYEEEHFTRLTIRKSDSAAMKKMNTMGNLGTEILSFRAFDDLNEGPSSGVKRKKTGKGKDKKGRKKKGSKKRR